MRSRLWSVVVAAVLVHACGGSDTSTSGSSSSGASPTTPATTLTYIGVWKLLRAGPNAETDVSASNQTLDIRSNGTIVHSVPPFACQINYTYTATGLGSTSGTWRSVLAATSCPNPDPIGLTRSGTWSMPDANSLNWFYEGRDNPGDMANHITMTRVS